MEMLCAEVLEGQCGAVELKTRICVIFIEAAGMTLQLYEVVPAVLQFAVILSDSAVACNHLIFAFLQLIRMWQGVKITAQIVNGMFSAKNPLSIKSSDGTTESTTDLRKEFSFQKTIQPKR